MHIRRHRSPAGWPGRGGNLARLDCVEDDVITPGQPGAGRSSRGFRPQSAPQSAPRSLCSRAVLAMVILCIAALGGCTSAPAPKGASVTTPAAATSPAGTPAWTELHPPATPPARGGGGSRAYDPATRTMLLFSGQSDRYPVYPGETWSWNGTTWTELHPPASPPARADAPIAYDAATRTVLLFGGEGMISAGEYGGLSDMWSWNGTTWTKLSPPASPGGSDDDSMAYDPATATVLLFRDGCCGSAGQTWSWNGTTWSRLTPPVSPPHSDGSSMAYDPATATVLLLLGYDYSPDQTWSWNGTTWSRLTPTASPPVDNGWSMAYDPATATVLLFGGISSDPSTASAMSPAIALGGTWSWNGTTWTKLSPATSPPPRSGASMTYDPATEAMLLSGNGDDGQFNDTWWTLKGPITAPGGA